jgi:hypothetical protein
MSNRSPALAEVIRLALERQGRALRVGLPGRIDRFDAANQLADVTPLLQETTFDETGAEVVESLPVLTNVPVQFAGGGGYAVTFPVASGDPCWLTFADRSIDEWIERGGVVDPVDLRRHDFADPVAILGVRSKADKLTEFDGSRAVFGNKGPRIAVDGSSVHLGVGNGASAGQRVLRGDAYRTAEDTLLDSIASAAQSAATALIAATAALASAGTANAVPVVGGIPAAPFFATAATQLTTAAIALQSIQGIVNAFKAQDSTFKANEVKVP